MLPNSWLMADASATLDVRAAVVLCVILSGATTRAPIATDGGGGGSADDTTVDTAAPIAFLERACSPIFLNAPMALRDAPTPATVGRAVFGLARGDSMKLSMLFISMNTARAHTDSQRAHALEAGRQQSPPRRRGVSILNCLTITGVA
jgi:hypothetical protein